jgi:arylsulfatase A-like enzyme
MNSINYYRPWKESRGDVNVVIRRGSWKGIWNDELQTLELYDLERDPGEQTDLSAAQPRLAAALGEQARAWLQACLSQATPPQELGEMDEQTQEQLRALGYFN